MYSNVIIGSFLSDYVSVNVKKPAQTPVNAESYAGYYCIKADNGIRTHDLLITNQLRYQLRYSGRTPTIDIILMFHRFGKSFLKKVSS